MPGVSGANPHTEGPVEITGPRTCSAVKYERTTSPTLRFDLCNIVGTARDACFARRAIPPKIAPGVGVAWANSVIVRTTGMADFRYRS